MYCKNRVKIRRIEVINLLSTITTANKSIRLIYTTHLSKIKTHS